MGLTSVEMMPLLTVDYGITPYMIHGVCLRDGKPRFTDDDSNLAFVVKSFGVSWVGIDVFICGNHTRLALGEYGRE